MGWIKHVLCEFGSYFFDLFIFNFEFSLFLKNNQKNNLMQLKQLHMLVTGDTTTWMSCCRPRGSNEQGAYLHGTIIVCFFLCEYFYTSNSGKNSQYIIARLLLIFSFLIYYHLLLDLSM